MFSSLLVYLEWFKTWWVPSYGFTKLLWYSKIEHATIQFFELEILICFNSTITKHWTPLHQTPRIFLISLSTWKFLAALEALGGGVQMFFEIQNQRNNVWEFNLYWILKCSLTGLCTSGGDGSPKGSKKVERATKSHTLTKTHLTSPLKPINLIFWGFWLSGKFEP
jgi:hypothetical protein